MMHFYVQEDLPLEPKQTGIPDLNPEWILVFPTPICARAVEKLCKHLSWLK